MAPQIICVTRVTKQFVTMLRKCWASEKEVKCWAVSSCSSREMHWVCVGGPKITKIFVLGPKIYDILRVYGAVSDRQLVKISGWDWFMPPVHFSQSDPCRQKVARSMFFLLKKLFRQMHFIKNVLSISSKSLYAIEMAQLTKFCMAFSSAYVALLDILSHACSCS